MSKILDIKKPVKEILIDKFNAKAGISLNYEYVELGAITVLDQTTNKENTEVEFLPTVTGSFLNKFKLRYNRMDLAEIFSAPYLLIPYNGFDKLYENLEDINLILGVNITPADVIDANIVSTVVAGKTVRHLNIKAKDTSYLFIGEVNILFDQETPGLVGKPDSNSIAYVAVKTADQDKIEALAFDGYKANAFKFMRNVDLVVSFKISSLYSTENKILVVNGKFNFVANKLSFIDPSKTYQSITMSKTGELLSAREEISPLGQVPFNNVIHDTTKNFYYIVDKANVIGIDNKRVYRLFENGTRDNSFVTSNLPDNIETIVSSPLGFYVVENKISKYIISRFTDDGIADASFSKVEINKDPNNNNIHISGLLLENTDPTKEVLYFYVIKDVNTISAAFSFVAPTINKDVSTDPAAFFSPVFTIEENGKVVNASGYLAKRIDPTILSTGVYPKIFKNPTGSVTLYSFNKQNNLAYNTVTPFIVGKDKEIRNKDISVELALDIVDLNKVLQISTGAETYVLATTLDHDTSTQATVILGFDAEQNLNGPLKVLQKTAGTFSDLAIIRK